MVEGSSLHCNWYDFHSPPSHASVTRYSSPSHWINQSSLRNVFCTKGLGEPSRGGRMGDQVASVMAVRKSPPLNWAKETV